MKCNEFLKIVIRHCDVDELKTFHCSKYLFTYDILEFMLL